MFRRPRETVNLNPAEKSTIAGAASVAERVMCQLPAFRARLPWRTRLGFWFAPPRCYACGGAGDLGAIDLCAACLGRWPHRADADAPPSLQGVVLHAAFDYREPVSTALRALKFQGDWRAARVLGTLLALRRLDRAAPHAAELPQCLVPIPLHPARLRERGFDQAALLARHIALWSAIPVRRWLRRTRSTTPQTELDGAARRLNVAGAFAATDAARSALARGDIRSIAILDDVVTTGSTAAAAIAALRAAAGAHGRSLDVQCWAVAATAKSTTIPTKITRPT